MSELGKVSQVIGPVIDVTFENNDTDLPDIYDSLEITRNDGSILVLECQQHIGAEVKYSHNCASRQRQCK